MLTDSPSEEMNASYEDGSASIHFDLEDQRENELSVIIHAIDPLAEDGGMDMDIDMNVDIKEASKSVSPAITNALHFIYTNTFHTYLYTISYRLSLLNVRDRKR